MYECEFCPAKFETAKEYFTHVAECASWKKKEVGINEADNHIEHN